MLTGRNLHNFAVPAGSLAVWWLGQAGFIFKSPAGRVIAVDPYLSNSCEAPARAIGVDHSRLAPPCIAASELAGIDRYVLTHSHQDHLDPETLQAYRNAGGAGPYLAPAETVEKLASLGVERASIVTTWPNHVHEVDDLSLRATFAIPFAGDDLTHVGYLVSAAGGPTFYLTGDTALHEVIGISVAEHHPDVMFTVINGMWRNMGPADAAALAHLVQPKVVIPYHYNLFPDGSVPAHTLRLNLRLHGMQDRFMTLEPGVPWVYAGGGNG